MPQKFQHKRNSTSGVVPTTGQVANGEIAINLADGIIYTNNGSAVIIVGRGTSGPASPAGSNTQIQFNDSGVANAMSGFTFDKTSNTLFVGVGSITGFSYTTTGTTAQNIDTYAVTTYRSAKYFYSGKDNATNAYQTGELIVIFDGTNALITEYAAIATNTSFLVWSAIANSTHTILQATPTSANTTIRIERIALPV